jgi:hypothetical protein
MTRTLTLRLALAGLMAVAAGSFLHAQDARWARDPKQAVDEDYTKKIKEYTTLPSFLSPLVDYLPASKTVPTPKSVIGDIAGAPGKLPYTAQIHDYMRALEKASPRVKVFSIGTSEEGREMIAVAIADAPLIAKLDENRARLARLADPRSIKLDDAEADRLVAASTPIYYITGTIHSPETGAPTALMELAYRLVVDDAPYIKAIRANLITLITPVVEVDGRDRQADIYNWHLAHPKENVPPLVYWGHYLVHDNNRDAMGATLALTKHVINTFVDQKAQLLHDLHESVPFLYDNTVGDGPYNAWVDPILTDEWQLIGWNNMSEMTKFGMPGAFTHGQFDTWSPGYLMFIAAMHNGTSRLYETFGNAGADTVERTLRPGEYARTWYRQNPPLPKVMWSQRNNNNYQETGLLTSLSYYAANSKLFLKNFYLKAKRSVLKPKAEGPAAYVFPADAARPGLQAELLRVLQTQRCEISRATAPFTASLPAKKRAAGTDAPPSASASQPPSPSASASQGPAEVKATEIRQFPAGSYIVRMDQPYSRIADALLDYQYWSPNDPQKNPYDDTGWTFGELFNVKVVRVTDPKVLDAAMEPVKGEVRAASSVGGPGAIFLVNQDTNPALFALRFRLKDAAFEAAEEPFEAAGRKFARGSFLISGASAADIRRVADELGIQVSAVAAAPEVKAHAVKTPRIAYVHTWLATQDEGWWRQALDRLKIPYDYISTQVVAATPNLGAKYDVVLFPPVGAPAAMVVSGMPMWGNPLPWKTTPLTPNLGTIDSTDDMRPGLGYAGLAALDAFVRGGGLLITTDDSSDLAVGYGLTQGVSVQRGQKLNVPGSVVRSKFVDLQSPIAYGYDEDLSVYLSGGLIFSVSNTMSGRGWRFGGGASDRPTGRGTADDPDIPQGRAFAEPPAEPKVEPWQAAPVTSEQLRNPLNVIPVNQRPRVILRFGDAKDLLVSGLVDGGSEIAGHPAVVDVPHDKGHVIVFSPNPIWRGETQGSYAMVFNAILNFDHLDAGRKWDEK